MAAKVWKGVYRKVFGCSCQLSLNMIFDPSTPSMREVNDGEKKMLFIVATNVVASRQPERQPTGMPHNCAKIQV